MQKLSDLIRNKRTLLIRCRKCGHSQEYEPERLVPKVGYEAPLSAITARFVCSVCQSRDLEAGPWKRSRQILVGKTKGSYM